MVLAYELWVTGPRVETQAVETVSQEEREQMFHQMQEALVEIGFLSQGSPEHIMQTLRGILAWPDLKPRELNILRGIWSQVSWYARQGYKLGPDHVKKP